MTFCLRSALLCGGTAVLLAGTPALADNAPHTIFDDINGVDLSVEGGYLMGSGNLPYAQYFDHVKDYAFTVGPGNGWNGKFEFNARFDSGWNVSASYAHSSSSKSAATASFDGSNTPFDYPVWNILGFQKDTGSTGSTSYNSATASTTVHTDIIDFEAGHDVGIGMPGHLMLLTGVRIGDFEQRTSMDLFCSRPAGSTGPGGCSPPPILEVAQNRGSRFQGFGPQLGAKYGVPITDSGLGLFSSGIFSALLGKQTTNTTSAWQSGSPFPTLSSFHDHNIALMLDARAGLSYTWPNCPTVIAVGYQLSWMNGVRDSANEAIAVGSTNHFGSHNSDLVYHGPFFRVTYSPY